MACMTVTVFPCVVGSQQLEPYCAGEGPAGRVQGLPSLRRPTRSGEWRVAGNDAAMTRHCRASPHWPLSPLPVPGVSPPRTTSIGVGGAITHCTQRRVLITPFLLSPSAIVHSWKRNLFSDQLVRLRSLFVSQFINI